MYCSMQELSDNSWDVTEISSESQPHTKRCVRTVPQDTILEQMQRIFDERTRAVQLSTRLFGITLNITVCAVAVPVTYDAVLVWFYSLCIMI